MGFCVRKRPRLYVQDSLAPQTLYLWVRSGGRSGRVRVAGKGWVRGGLITCFNIYIFHVKNIYMENK